MRIEDRPNRTWTKAVEEVTIVVHLGIW